MTAPARTIAIGSPEYNAAVAWYYREAQLLDDGDPATWLADMVSEDVVYRVPVRETRRRGDGEGPVSPGYLVDDRHASLRMRVQRWSSASAWTEDPPACTRRFVGNVQVAMEPGRLAVRSHLLLYRTRDGGPFDLVSAERHDVLDIRSITWRLASREARLDTSVLPLRGLDFLL